MTAIKAEAIQMMEQVPDSLVMEWISTMRNYINLNTASTDANSANKPTTSNAFNNFLSHCKPGTLTDNYQEELATILEQNYENIH